MNKQKYAQHAHRENSIPESDAELSNNSFSTLIPELQRAVKTEGYITPTPIQEQCIPHLLNGRDLMGSAQTGTGKTAAFILPILHIFSKSSGSTVRGTPRALILAPTRELAAQIGESIQTYGRYLRLNHTVVFGGVSQVNQVKALNRGTDILVATPGRLLDLIKQGHIRLNKIEIFVLDEMDRMLDMGFIPDIKRILAQIPAKRQTLFFSATMSPKIMKLASTMVNNPVQVNIEPDKPTVDRIIQKVLFVNKNNKDALLISLLKNPGINKALVFTQRKQRANRVMNKLNDEGINVTAIHGNKSQAARTKALDGFKRGRFRVLVATDVAARGLDVDDISHVINYDLPMDAETYVHRIGRTARAGAGGDAISLCCTEDRAYLTAIERLLGSPVSADTEHAYHCDTAFRSEQTTNQTSNRRSGKDRNRRPRNRKPGRFGRTSMR